MLKRLTIKLAEGHIKPAIQVSNYEDILPAIEALGLHTSSPVLVIIGGASDLRNDAYERLQSLFVDVLAPLAQTLNMIVVDGGTNDGVMKLIGQARQHIRATFPLLGITPTGLADFPNTPFNLAEDKCTLEPNHTHFILIPGYEWGSESSWMAMAATLIAEGKPSIAILANGGQITWKDAQQNVAVDRRVVVVRGSGRTADIIANALDGKVSDDRARQLIDSELLCSIHMSEDFEKISHELHQILEMH